MTNNTLVGTLNNLIETCKEGEEGFRTAAEHVQNSEFRRLFNTLSQQRAEFVAELQDEVRRLNGIPSESGGIAGLVHRGWMNLKAAVLRHDEAAIITECQNGENVAISRYQTALQETLPPELQEIVKRHYMDIKDASDTIGILRRAA